jgi:hypothetical protein
VTSKMWHRGTLFFVGIIAFGCSQVWAQDPGETGFHASVDGEFRYGNIQGFVQIPRGGGAGTTSSERPKFDEIGINQAAIGAPSLTLGGTITTSTALHVLSGSPVRMFSAKL